MAIKYIWNCPVVLETIEICKKKIMIINTNNNRNCSKLQSDKLSWAFGSGELKSKQENSGKIKFLFFFFMSINGYQEIRTGHDKADQAPVLQPKPALCYIIIIKPLRNFWITCLMLMQRGKNMPSFLDKLLKDTVSSGIFLGWDKRVCQW